QIRPTSTTVACSPATGLQGAERCAVRADYERYDWRAHASWNAAAFYDLFGPTKVSRKGYNATIAHSTTLLYDQPKRMTPTIQGTAAGNLDRLPQFQNIAVNVDRLYSADAELAYTDVRASLG